jgi:hypothetical protein
MTFYSLLVMQGWINDENPRDVAARIATEHNFQVCIDLIDSSGLQA